MTLVDINAMFQTDEKCREMLARLRWPEGPRCLRCKADVVELETDKQLFYCKDCDYQFSVTGGDGFQRLPTSPARNGLLATLLLCEAKKGMSACQIQRTLGIGSYKTAWYLCHRIRAAMVQVDRPMLDGKLEMDETYVGGLRTRAVGIAGRGTDKEIVIGIRQRDGELRLFHPKNIKAETMAKYIRENVSKDAEVILQTTSGRIPMR